MIANDRMRIDAETVHNWTQRYAHVRHGQLATLPQDVRAAILRAHLAHHRAGEDAGECAKRLAAQFPVHLTA